MSQLLSRWCPWPAATLFLCFSPTSFKLLNSIPCRKSSWKSACWTWEGGSAEIWGSRVLPCDQAKVRCYETGGRADNVNREQGQGQPCPEGMVSYQNFFALFYYFLENGWFLRFDMIYLRPLKLETPFSPLKWPDFLNKHITHFDLHPIHCIHCRHW